MSPLIIATLINVPARTARSTAVPRRCNAPARSLSFFVPFFSFLKPTASIHISLATVATSAFFATIAIGSLPPRIHTHTHTHTQSPRAASLDRWRSVLSSSFCTHFVHTIYRLYNLTFKLIKSDETTRFTSFSHTSQFTYLHKH